MMTLYQLLSFLALIVVIIWMRPCIRVYKHELMKNLWMLKCAESMLFFHHYKESTHGPWGLRREASVWNDHDQGTWWEYSMTVLMKFYFTLYSLHEISTIFLSLPFQINKKWSLIFLLCPSCYYIYHRIMDIVYQFRFYQFMESTHGPSGLRREAFSIKNRQWTRRPLFR